jgi:hypothetical protein
LDDSPAAALSLEPVDVEGSDERDFDPLDERPPLEDRRSTFAQPEPLNRTAGADSALRIVPSAPHSGQNRGPASLMPWMTSVTRPQLVQV